MAEILLPSDGENGAERLSLLDHLRDMIAEAENAGMHHCPIGTVEREHYDRLIDQEAVLARNAKNIRTTTLREFLTTGDVVPRFDNPS